METETKNGHKFNKNYFQTYIQIIVSLETKVSFLTFIFRFWLRGGLG